MRLALACLLAVTSMLLGLGLRADPSASFIVIAHPNTQSGDVSRKFLSEAFLKKTTRWEDGSALRPVDQGMESEVRRKFSEDVLKRSIAAVRSYWQQLIFAGRDVPPPELTGDAEVVSYVLKYAGAVGYVAPSTKLNGAKVISIR
jgi:ABC-type phosphate transport system substrate-binding protein